LFAAKHRWFTPVILATQEAEIRRIVVQKGKQFAIPYLEKILHKKGLLEWLKV
jgi:FixJ family two-component response regulator